MAVWSVVEFLEMQNVGRWEAEYYQPTYLDLDALFSKMPHVALGSIADIVFGTTPPGGVFSEQGIPFIRSQDFTNGVVSQDCMYCEPSFHDQHLGSAVRPKDVLLAAIGATIGELSIVPCWIEEGNTNQNIARVRPFDEKYKPEYLWAYFLSTTGQLQLHRRGTGNAQPYLNTYQFQGMVIPYLEDQSPFVDVYKQLEDIVAGSVTLYEEAEAELLERLGWDELDAAPKELFYTENFADLTDARRCDPEFFQPQYARLRQRIDERGGMRVGDFCDAITRGVQPRLSPDGDILALDSKSVRPQGVQPAEEERVSRAFYDLPGNASAHVHAGDVLLNSTGRGTLGRAACYQQEELALCDNHVAILRPDPQQCLPVYLSLFLNSLAGLAQSEQYQTGSSGQLEIYPSHIAEFQVFLPRNRDGSVDVAWQQALADKVQMAGAAKAKAREKLDEAKQLIEEALTP